jgi:hypothetical protein
MTGQQSGPSHRYRTGTEHLYKRRRALHDSCVTSAIRTKANGFQVFVALQCLDALTTLIFLSRGVTEGNPVVSGMMPFVHAQWIGLFAAKSLAMLIGFYCYRHGKFAALRIANFGYAAIVAWNLLTIAAAAFTS